jgi:hypothetical protein
MLQAGTGLTLTDNTLFVNANQSQITTVGSIDGTLRVRNTNSASISILRLLNDNAGDTALSLWINGSTRSVDGGGNTATYETIWVNSGFIPKEGTESISLHIPGMLLSLGCFVHSCPGVSNWSMCPSTETIWGVPIPISMSGRLRSRSSERESMCSPTRWETMVK